MRKTRKWHTFLAGSSCLPSAVGSRKRSTTLLGVQVLCRRRIRALGPSACCFPIRSEGPTAVRVGCRLPLLPRRPAHITKKAHVIALLHPRARVAQPDARILRASNGTTSRPLALLTPIAQAQAFDRSPTLGHLVGRRLGRGRGLVGFGVGADRIGIYWNVFRHGRGLRDRGRRRRRGRGCIGLVRLSADPLEQRFRVAAEAGHFERNGSQTKSEQVSNVFGGSNVFEMRSRSARLRRMFHGRRGKPRLSSERG